LLSADIRPPQEPQQTNPLNSFPSPRLTGFSPRRLFAACHCALETIGSCPSGLTSPCAPRASPL